jgi:hypothetical protein
MVIQRIFKALDRVSVTGTETRLGVAPTLAITNLPCLWRHRTLLLRTVRRIECRVASTATCAGVAGAFTVALKPSIVSVVVRYRAALHCTVRTMVLWDQSIIGGLSIVAQCTSQILVKFARSICCDVSPWIVWIANEPLAHRKGWVVIAVTEA